MGGMSPGAAAGNPALTLMLALAHARLRPVGRRPGSPPGHGPGMPRSPAAPRVRSQPPITRPALAPRLATCYTIAMASTMGYMLLTML